MGDLIGGIVALVLIFVFMGFYVVGLHALPFTIIVVAVGALILIEFVEGVWKGKGETKQ